MSARKSAFSLAMHARTFCLAAAALALLITPLEGCKKTIPTPARAQQGDPMAIVVTPALAANLKLGTPQMRAVAGTLQVAARVETDASRIARVGSPVAGLILKLLAFEGQQVQRGAVLATLHSTNLSDTQFAFLRAYSQETLAEAATRRADQLVAADVIGLAELEKRRAELLQATAEAASYRTQLKGLGMTDAQINRLETARKLSADYPIVTPSFGTVLERKVTAGQVVQPAELAYLVADLSNVWVVANVPEEEAGALRKGMEVDVRIPALPNEKPAGRLSFVSPIVDPATRTVEVRMDLANRQGLYKPDQLASMMFVGHTEQKLTVPMTAVVREENKDYVFVQTVPNAFLLREVALGDQSDDTRVLISGVSAGERIVLDGSFHLNNQRKQNAIKGGE